MDVVGFDTYSFLSSLAIFFVNVFFIPTISVLIYNHKLVKKQLEEKEMILYLGLFSAINIISSKTIVQIISIFFMISYDVYSIPFCYIEFILSLMIPYIVFFIQVRFNCEVEIKNEKK